MSDDEPDGCMLPPGFAAEIRQQQQDIVRRLVEELPSEILKPPPRRITFWQWPPWRKRTG